MPAAHVATRSSRASTLSSLVALALVLAVGAAAPRRGRPPDANKAAAKEHYQSGTSYYDLGRYPDAIKEFEAAYELKNDPAFLYNLAQSYRQAGDPEQALHFYRTYLRYVPKPPNRAEIEERIARARAAGRAEGRRRRRRRPPVHDAARRRHGTTTPPPPAGGGARRPAPTPPTTTPPPGAATPPPPRATAYGAAAAGDASAAAASDGRPGPQATRIAGIATGGRGRGA